MQKRTCCAKILLFFIASVFCHAQEADGGFWNGAAKAASFGKPFWADVHSTLIRAELGYASNSPDYDWGETNSKFRPFIFANLGADIPVWSGNLNNEKYGLCITLPFMIDVWYDRFEWITSPIINTAYRFGVFDACFIYRIDAPPEVFPYFSIYNWAVKISAFKHESTHIGDELTIFRKDNNLPVTRVDVAYNYGELIFILNDPDGQTHSNHGFKTGILFNYKFKQGWYRVLESDAQAGLVEKSRIPIEFYLQYQYQSALFSKGFQIVTSVEYRIRERYRYPFFVSDANNDSSYGKNDGLNPAHCVNVFAGIRYNNQKLNYLSKIGIGLRYYYGINPYGQFRSMPDYHQVGLAVIFE